MLFIEHLIINPIILKIQIFLTSHFRNLFYPKACMIFFKNDKKGGIWLYFLSYLYQSIPEKSINLCGNLAIIMFKRKEKKYCSI